MDEHRVGLKPIMRRVWASPGYRPVVSVQHRYQWLYVYGFVQPSTGHSFWLLMPTVSIAAFSVALREFARFVNPADAKVIQLIVDRAGWHTSPAVQWPAAMRPWFLPPYSPELQPAEHLWPLVDVPLINRHFASLDALELVLADRCCTLQDHPAILRSATHFPWWPQAV